MKSIKYFAEVLAGGKISIPDTIKKQLEVKKGEKLEVILSYITVKGKKEGITSLQGKIHDQAPKKLSLKEIDKLVHKIRQS